MIISDTPHIQRISNHPVHIMPDGQQSISPSAFIPFCSFGGNMSVMGKSVDNFNIPVCDKFRPTFLEGQLCYQLDANKFSKKVNKEEIASQGVVMLLDYNLDRMVTHKEDDTLTVEDSSLLKKNKKNINDAMIYIETLGINNFNKN